MSFAIVAGITAGASIIGGVMQSRAAKKAADAQRDAANQATDIEYKMFLENQKLQQPLIDARDKALNQLTTGLAPGGQFATPFSHTNWMQDPGYSFRLDQGIKALDRSAASRGGLLSGNQLKSVNDYAQGAASQEYQNAFNRYYTERQNQLAPIQSLAGLGQSAAQQVGQAGMAFGAQAGANYIGAGDARAAGIVGSTNALVNGLGGAFNNYADYNALKFLKR